MTHTDIIRLDRLERWAETCRHKARPGQTARATRAAKFGQAIYKEIMVIVEGTVTTYSDSN